MLSRWRRCVAQALVEFALVFPLITFLSLGVVQLVLYAHARDLVTSSAQEGARLAAEDGRGVEEGRARAHALVVSGLGSSVDPLHVDGSTDEQTDAVRVRIDGALRPILPLPFVGLLPVHAEAVVARERFRPGGS